jgi:glyoxylase-like metal-dependent hydrolase (beta-lactamase superfamily II)
MTPPQMIDLNFLGMPGTVASYLLATPEGLALIDCGPSTTLDALEAGMRRLGAELSDLRHLLLTHIHLDHAGAAGSLQARLPELQVYVHERGAPHLIRPERLIASATQIYGEHMQRLWGEFRPVEAGRLTVLRGGETILGGIQTHYTPGHAVHHLTYQSGGELFVGDVGGIRVVAEQSARPPTPPPDIDLDAWHSSIERLRGLEADTLHLAHFGSYPQHSAHWDGLSANMQTDAERVGRRLAAGEAPERITAAYTAELEADLNAEGEGIARRFEATCPPWMNVQGLTRYFSRKAARLAEQGERQ